MNKTLRNLALVALVAAPFSAFAEIQGSGTAEDPWQISSKEDLCSAWNLPVNGVVNYFIQTADIDMAGVEDYIPLNVKAADWSRTINYDGQNHVIKNFGPKWHADGAAVEGNTNSGQYYVTSIFGVVNGVVKNLGVVNATLNTAGASQRAGILCGYAGSSSSTVAKDVLFENIYITGKVLGGTRNTGGFAGLNQLPVTIKNCFVNLDMSCEGRKDGNAMLFGESQQPVTIETSYVAGKVSGPCNFALDNIGTHAVTVDGFVVFAEGADAKLGFTDSDNAVTMANTTATKADGIAEVKEWAAFSKTETVDGLPALEYNLSGTGTETDPYIIDGQRALCNAYRYIDTTVPGTEAWFVQTADIDMKGVSEYHAISGSAGGTADSKYYAVIHYDGKNHVIKNFAPTDYPAIVPEGASFFNTYYCTTIFGVPAGEIKNLGVIGADIEASQGSGILGAYAGHGAATTLTVENVFVEGSITGDSYTGGMFGTTGKGVVLTNCFANVDVVGPAGTTAGIIGRQRNEVEFNNVYVAGTVSEGSFLVCGTDKSGAAAPSVFVTDGIAFNTGVTAAFPADILTNKDTSGAFEVATEATKANLIKEVQAWEAFSATKNLNGYPILADFEDYGTTGIFEAAVEVEEADAPAVYYNLQGVQVANPDNGIYIVRRGNKVTKELIRK